jgi:ribose-phosphate pyrophosphokinase
MTTNIRITKDSYFLFSGGEVHVKLDDFNSREAAYGKSPFNLILLDYSMDGLMAAFQYKQILNKLGSNNVSLTLPYLPYARQDRNMEQNEPFSLRIFCSMLNAAGFSKVTVWDPHSDVGPALINHVSIIPQDELARKCVPSIILNTALLVSPDAGAYKKISKIRDPLAVGNKVRNSNGVIVSTQVLHESSLVDRECLIIDDICDGGRTFIELAKALKAKGCADIHLYVTHGIFSKGEQTIKELVNSGITSIATTNSIQRNFTHPALFVREII